jgi:amino acid transporter
MLVTYIVIYLLSYLVSYIGLKYFRVKILQREWKKSDREITLIVSFFSIVTIILGISTAAIIYLLSNTEEGKQAKW